MSGPEASTAAVSQRMASQRERNTRPELDLRRALYRLGYRYRIHRRIPGTRREIDIAFPGPRIAVFVDGCYWHGCPRHGTLPHANRGWWANKLRMNQDRDRDTDLRLEELGWTSVRIWEHVELTEAVHTVRSLLEEARSCGARARGAS